MIKQIFFTKSVQKLTHKRFQYIGCQVEPRTIEIDARSMERDTVQTVENSPLQNSEYYSKEMNENSQSIGYATILHSAFHSISEKAVA